MNVENESDISSDESVNERREMKIENLLSDAESPGLHLTSGFDVPIYRDK